MRVCFSVGSEDMFKSAMSTMNIDVKKMPLGQLSNAQVRLRILLDPHTCCALTLRPDISGGKHRPKHLVDTWTL